MKGDILQKKRKKGDRLLFLGERELFLLGNSSQRKSSLHGKRSLSPFFIFFTHHNYGLLKY